MTASAFTLREVDFLAQVTEYAELRGWQWAHFRPAQTTRGWRTPVQGPLGQGFPDLVLAREKDHRLIFAELKSDRGPISMEQRSVLQFLSKVTPEVYIWRPRDWPQLMETLA